MIWNVPRFWSHDTFASRALSPASWVVAGYTASRMRRPGWVAPVPVICCGNVTVGGTGKTPIVQDLVTRIDGAHVITRGYGGATHHLHRVSRTDSFRDVGDEALLHARLAPTWRCADRAAAARSAVEAGAKALIMDDGLQNPSLHKTASFLIIDGETGFGNGRVLPAGPLREPVEAAARRSTVAVIVGADKAGALRQLPGDLPVLRADFVQDPQIQALKGRRIIAFAGIGRPEKFFQPLHAAGAIIIAAQPFPDHHPYTESECRILSDQAEAADAVLVTTPKDAVRLPAWFLPRLTVIGVHVTWQDPDQLEHLLQKVIVTGGQPMA